MRKILLILGLLFVAPAVAAAQDAPPRWDVNASAGLFQGRPSDDSRGWDHWYSEGRYGASIGYYWTDHLKTEIEFATTGEGHRYTQETVAIPGMPVPYPINIEMFHRLRQTSARAVWQFRDNAWVHPYLSAGIVFDVEQTRRWSPEQYYYPPGDPRTVPRIPINDAIDATTTDRRVGFAIGGGSKFYVSPSAYINTALQVSRAKPSTTVTVLAGMGVEF